MQSLLDWQSAPFLSFSPLEKTNITAPNNLSKVKDLDVQCVQVSICKIGTRSVQRLIKQTNKHAEHHQLLKWLHVAFLCSACDFWTFCITLSGYSIIWKFCMYIYASSPPETSLTPLVLHDSFLWRDRNNNFSTTRYYIGWAAARATQQWHRQFITIRIQETHCSQKQTPS